MTKRFHYKSNMYESAFDCTECGRRLYLPRKDSKRREKNHIKDLWCPFCKKVCHFIERGEYEV